MRALVNEELKGNYLTVSPPLVRYRCKGFERNKQTTMYLCEYLREVL